MRPSSAEENYYKQFWWNIKALHLPIVETAEHWFWRTAAWRRLRDFNVNANNSFNSAIQSCKEALNQPLGPKFDLGGNSVQARTFILGPKFLKFIDGILLEAVAL